VVLSAPYDHTNDGVHAITVKARDVAGNVATKTFYVRIDTQRPTVVSQTSLDTSAGQLATVSYRVDESGCSCGEANVKFAVGNGHSTVESWTVRRMPLNKSCRATFVAPFSRGTYTLHVYATDIAGNVQQSPGVTELQVN
jgi:hypothetical protein